MNAPTMNIHTPERQPNESQAQYRDRRAISRLAVERATKPHLFTRRGERIRMTPKGRP